MWTFVLALAIGLSVAAFLGPMGRLSVQGGPAISSSSEGCEGGGFGYSDQYVSYEKSYAIPCDPPTA